MGKIAVTGAKGMIGRHMVALLKSENIDCLALTKDDWDIGQWKELDKLDTLFADVDAVFHFAARLPMNNTAGSNIETQMLFDANVRSCLNLSEWAKLRNIPFVFLSGATVYENAHNTKIYEDDPKVISGFGGFYGYSKLIAENLIQHYIQQGLNAIILRPSSVYGYGLTDEKLIQHYLNLALSSQKIKIDQPSNRINLIHSLDVAKAALQAYKAKAWGVYNIASNYSPSIAEIAEMAIKVCGSGSIELNPDAPNGFLRFDLDFTKAAAAFAFSPTIDLEKGLMLTKLKRVIEC